MGATPKISIRRGGPGDEIALSLVGQAAFLEAFAGVIPGKDIIEHCAHQHAREKYAAWLKDSATAVWLAEVEPGHAPVGYLVLTTPELPLPDLSQQDAEIKRIYLLHRFQGSGIGARLMRAAHAEAQARGLHRLLLGVYGKNAAAISFYEKQGYRMVGRRTFKVGSNTYDDFIFGLSIGT